MVLHPRVRYHSKNSLSPSINPFTDDKILERSKLKQSADDNIKFDENSRKFSERVENTVGKGEMARYEQFLLFPQCFQKACFPGASKGVIVWESVKVFELSAITLPSIWSNQSNFIEKPNLTTVLP